MQKSGKKIIRVGVVGASVDRGWASMAHIPALRALDNFDVTAVCTTNMSSATMVADTFGIDAAFDDPVALAAHADVDMVAVTVKASAHYSVLQKIIGQKKPILCEWPGGKDAGESAQILDAARKAGIATFTGLQSRHIPALCYVRDMLAEGIIGDVLSLDLISTAGVWGGMVHPGDVYALDARNGATILSIWGGHTLDMIWSLFGEFGEVSAFLASQRKTVAVLGSSESVALNAPDNLFLTARMKSGSVANVRLRGGPHAGTAFLLEIVGSSGVISISGEGVFAMVISDLKIGLSRSGEMALQRVEVPESYFRLPRDRLTPMALNVAQMYEAIRMDMEQGTHLAATFEDVVARKAQLEKIQILADAGKTLVSF